MVNFTAHLITERTPLLYAKCAYKVVVTESQDKQDLKIYTNLVGARHVQALLLFFGMCFAYFLRVNISAAIVPMTEPTPGQTYHDWDSGTKSLILSSFFWGYVAAQMPASMLAKRFGGKIVLGGATVISSFITIFHPLASNNADWEVICVLRVLVGFTQGVVYPCIHTLLAKWAPFPERGFLATSVYSGAQFGTALLLAVSGNIFDSSIGWPGIFYITGGIGLLWSVIFFIFGADTPRDTKMISKEEREYIEALTGSDQESKTMAVPWKSIFTSLPFFGLIAAHCGFTWGFYTLLTEMPTYLNKVLHLDVKSNALLSALPYFVMWLLCLTVSPISDMLINRKILSVTVSRKLFNSIGQWVPMVCLIALGYMTEDEKTLAIVLLTIGVGFNAGSFCGYLVNHMDLSPNFAGPMMGITNCISNLCSICAPLVVGAIVSNEENPDEWRIVFFITAGVYLVCNSLFVIFGKGTVQPWNDKVVTNSTTTLPNDAAQTAITSVPIYGQNSKEN
ncbi:putative inorganic phosphate cotransporter isoform X1 [Lucilia cuprina]|uniref:putative inorganic phosphate cotransporter isoform X1 n=2 Tax=Lucilia cuprina TaxID=7375 RepID=UPI001F05CA36|nr:putative inorganic phosphate cotransporter isoform X1 [Lucilia cuprina]